MSNIVFLVGAGRSGTTLLYKLLALHDEVAVITNYDSKLLRYSPAALFMRAIRQRPNLKKSFWFTKGGGAYFRPGLQRLFPYPVEGEPLYEACGVPLVIDPSRPIPDDVGARLRSWFLRLQKLHGGAVFVNKRTANNRRMAWLREVFPDARFVNLLRDGREVAYSLSTVDWWEDHLVWWSGQRAREMEANGWDRLRICARNWVEETTALEAGLADLPPERRLDLRYENLLHNPIEVLEQVLSFMSVDAHSGYFDVVNALGLNERPPKWRDAWSPEELSQVTEIQKELLAKYGYVTDPGPAIEKQLGSGSPS